MSIGQNRARTKKWNYTPNYCLWSRKITQRHKNNFFKTELLRNSIWTIGNKTELNLHELCHFVRPVEFSYETITCILIITLFTYQFFIGIQGVSHLGIPISSFLHTCIPFPSHPCPSHGTPREILDPLLFLLLLLHGSWAIFFRTFTFKYCDNF